MSEPRGIVLSHGSIGEALVDAVKSIVGETGRLQAISNRGCDRSALRERVQAALGDGPTFVFVDLLGGSCHRAAIATLAEGKPVVVVSGVNLAMLVDFVSTNETDVESLADHLVSAGTRGIRAVKP